MIDFPLTKKQDHLFITFKYKKYKLNQILLISFK